MVKIGDMEAKAVIFDFDGVIVDTEPLHYKAFQQILNPIGISFTWNEYVAGYMGFDDRDAFREAFKSYSKPLTDSELYALIDKKAQAFIRIIEKGISPYHGVIELIKLIKSRKIPLAISSGALKSDIEPILISLGIYDFFDAIVTADDVKTSKPDPECYILAYNKLLSLGNNSEKIAPSSVVAIEDTPQGIRAAKLAGLRVVAVTNSYTADYLYQADQVLSSL